MEIIEADRSKIHHGQTDFSIRDQNQAITRSLLAVASVALLDKSGNALSVETP